MNVELQRIWIERRADHAARHPRHRRGRLPRRPGRRARAAGPAASSASSTCRSPARARPRSFRDAAFHALCRPGRRRCSAERADARSDRGGPLRSAWPPSCSSSGRSPAGFDLVASGALPAPSEIAGAASGATRATTAARPGDRCRPRRSASSSATPSRSLAAHPLRPRAGHRAAGARHQHRASSRCRRSPSCRCW